MIINASKCEATGKSRYPTPGDAKNAILTITRRNRSKNRHKKITGKGGAKRYYKCVYCNGFHLTSTTYRTNRAYIKDKMKSYSGQYESLVKTVDEALKWKKDSLPFPKM